MAFTSFSYQPPLPFHVAQRGGCAELNGVIYVFGHFGGGSIDCVPTVHTYTRSTATWSTTATPMPYGLYECTATTIGSKIYVLGGGLSNSGIVSQNLYEYDPAGDTWTAKAAYGVPITGHGAATNGTLLYATGGLTDYSSRVANLAMKSYNPATNLWTTLAPIIGALNNFCMEYVSGKIYTFGGCATFFAASESAGINIYDVTGDSWSVNAISLPAARRGPYSGISNGLIYICGGSLASVDYATIYIFNPVGGTISTSTSALPNATSDGVWSYSPDGLYMNIIGRLDPMNTDPLAAANLGQPMSICGCNCSDPSSSPYSLISGGVPPSIGSGHFTNSNPSTSATGDDLGIYGYLTNV